MGNFVTKKRLDIPNAVHTPGAITSEWGGSSDRLNLVVFRLNRQSYALPVEHVMQIILMVAITSIPQVSDVVEGVINVHGAPVPVVNLGRHLGLRETPLQLYTPILLLRVGEWTVGLIVDEVLDVLSFAGDQIARPADILPEELGEAAVLQGLAYSEGGMVLLLDPDHLFRPEQMQVLAQVTDILAEEADEEISTRIPTAAYDIPVAEMGLSKRVMGHLERGGVENVGQVLEHLSEGNEGLLNLDGIGLKSLTEVREALDRLGLLPAAEETDLDKPAREIEA